MSEIKTSPKRLVDLNPYWVMVHGRDEVYGIRYDCPCGLPTFEPQYEDGKVKVGADGKAVGWDQCCPVGGWVVVPTKSNWLGKPVSADALRKGWTLTGSSFESVTLAPSIHCVGHWHGWLRNGVLESC